MRLSGRIGGSFAPPLTDAKLDEYEELIATLDPKSQVRDAMETLHRCCVAWWNEEYSTSPRAPHPVGIGHIVDLDKEIADRLFPHIPWMEELEIYGKLFDMLEVEAADRNTLKIEKKYKQIEDDLFSVIFPHEKSPADVRARVTAYKKIVEAAGIVGKVGAAVIDSFLPYIIPNYTSDKIREDAAKLEEWQKITHEEQCIAPKPADLEPTPVRNAALHMLWFATELCLDREPITYDML